MVSVLSLVLMSLTTLPNNCLQCACPQQAAGFVHPPDLTSIRFHLLIYCFNSILKALESGPIKPITPRLVKLCAMVNAQLGVTCNEASDQVNPYSKLETILPSQHHICYFPDGSWHDGYCITPTHFDMVYCHPLFHLSQPSLGHPLYTNCMSPLKMMP